MKHLTDEMVRDFAKSLRTDEKWEPMREYLRRAILRASAVMPKDGNEAFYKIGFINGLNDIYKLMLEADEVKGVEKTEDDDNG